MSDIVERIDKQLNFCTPNSNRESVLLECKDEIEHLRGELITTFKSLQQSNGVVVDQAKQLVELDEQLAAHQWQPIETAPKDGLFYIGFYDEFGRWHEKLTTGKVPAGMHGSAKNTMVWAGHIADPTHWKPHTKPEEGE